VHGSASSGRELDEDITTSIKEHTDKHQPRSSHSEFIAVVEQKAAEMFPGNCSVEIRVSHPVKGRVPDAKDKPDKDLQAWEKTLY